jgi:hypothetical protein
MKIESPAHAAIRQRFKTRPVYFARFFHVPLYGGGTEYPFAVDFSSAPVQAWEPGVGTGRPKWKMLSGIDGAFAQVFPEQGRASIGNISLTLSNIHNLALFYLSCPTFHLGAAMTPTYPGPGDPIVFPSPVFNLPHGGTLEIETAGVIERVRYIGLAQPSTTIECLARGRDGTSAAAHAVGDPVRNGEQIRSGQRCQIFAGYAELNEADYMPFAKMEVVDRRLDASGEAFVIELGDVQRTLRSQIFLPASDETPVVIIGDPLELLLRVLVSTGTGTNGPYDTFPAGWGLGIPQVYVDTPQIQAVAAQLAPLPTFTFDIREAVTAQDWIEKEIMQVVNVYPVVNQHGQYSVRRFGGQR